MGIKNIFNYIKEFTPSELNYMIYNLVRIFVEKIIPFEVEQIIFNPNFTLRLERVLYLIN